MFRGPASKIPYGGKATAVFALVLVTIFWAGTTQRSYAELNEARSSELSKNANLALALDVQTDQLLKGIDQFLLLIKDQYEGITPPMPLRRLAGPAFASASSITFIGVTDAKGNVIESLHEFAPTNVRDREFFQLHQQGDTGRLVISEPVLGRISGRWAITLTRRINRPDHSFGGIAAISIEPRHFTQLFENTALGPSDVMSLVLANGITLARRKGETISFGEDISRAELMQEVQQRSAGALVAAGGLDGQRRIFAYRTMADYPVIVTVGTLESDALAGVRQRIRGYYVVAFALTLLVGTGAIVGIQLLARNERANQTLREQASLLDKAQDAILVMDLQRRLTYWNKSAERVYGWTAAQVMGRSAFEVFYPDGDAREAQQAYELAMSRGEWTGELRPRAKDGRYIITESRWTLVRDGGGVSQSILSINTDVTDRRQLEQQFYRAQRLDSIGTLAGGIAHDLNNVLAPIMMGVGLLREKATDAESEEVLDTIAASTQHGAEMVAQVLAFARGEEGKRVEIRPVDLIADVVRIARDTLPKTIEIVTDVDAHLPPILGDPTQCHQVLLNLCVNARDAMPQGGRLRLSASTETIAPHHEMPTELRPGSYVVIRVEDTGSGIAPHLLDKIFDPFFTTKQAGKGTGLGLSTSQTIVRSHGGHIRASSEIGLGSRFDVYLPFASASSSVPTNGRRVAAPKGTGQVVLVVDDEESVRNVLSSTLSRAGYQVLEAANGKEALEVYAASGQSIAAVVIDMTMPVLGGLPTMQELVKMNPDVRIIAASGIHDNEALARSIGQPLKEFLAKPFTSEMLLRAVAAAVAGS